MVITTQWLADLSIACLRACATLLRARAGVSLRCAGAPVSCAACTRHRTAERVIQRWQRLLQRRGPELRVLERPSAVPLCSNNTVNAVTLNSQTAFLVGCLILALLQSNRQKCYAVSKLNFNRWFLSC